MQIFINIAVAILATTVHEWGHAAMAFYCGDYTARPYMTFNPLINVNCRLIALVEFVKFWGIYSPMVTYGYVRYNHRNLRGRFASLWVALAGPAMELCLYLICESYLANIHNDLSNLLYSIFSIRIASALTWFIVNFVRALQGHCIVSVVFNLLPLPSLDGFAFLETFWPDLGNQLLSYPHQELWVPFLGTYLVKKILQFKL